MDWLARFFSLGRLGRPPRERPSGVNHPLASAQRTQLGLREVDPPRGVVTLRSGEVRAIVAVSGFPAHHASAQEAHGFLVRLAAAVNALPPETAWLLRSRKGVTDAYRTERRAQVKALQAKHPGTALARLGEAQLAHVERLSTAGVYRRLDHFVAVRQHRGDVRALLQSAEAVCRHLRAAGLKAALLTDNELVAALAASWNPYATEAVDMDGREGTRLRILGHSAFVGRTPPPRAARPAARGAPVLAHNTEKALPW